MRTTVRLPAELHRRLRILAAASGRTFNDLIISAVRQSLEAPGAGAGLAPGGHHARPARPAAMLREAAGDLGAEVLQREAGGSVRVPAALLRRAGIADADAVRVQVQPGRLVLEGLVPVTDQLAGSAPDLWREDPVTLQRRLRREWQDEA